MSLTGLSMVPLPRLESIPSGFSLVNSPDVDLASPPRFPSLTGIENGFVIAGSTSEAITYLENAILSLSCLHHDGV